MGQIKMRSTCHFSSVLHEAAERSSQGKTRESVGVWSEKNNPPKFKSVCEIMFKISNERVYDAYCNGLFFTKETNNFFSQV